MLEFKKLCDSFEKLSTVEKGLLLGQKSLVILERLHALAIPGVEPVEALAGFLIGSVVADGRVNEREYLLIYPALTRVFGRDFDFASIKAAFRRDVGGRRQVAAYTEEMLKVFALLDEELRGDILTLCLCVVAIDGKVSLREKLYIRRLCKA